RARIAATPGMPQSGNAPALDHEITAPIPVARVRRAVSGLAGLRRAADESREHRLERREIGRGDDRVLVALPERGADRQHAPPGGRQACRGRGVAVEPMAADARERSVGSEAAALGATGDDTDA